MDFINEAQKLADTVRDKAQEAANNVVNGMDEVVDGIKNATAEMTTSSVHAVNDLQNLSTIAAQSGFQTVQNVSKTFQQTAVGVAASNMVMADALQNLPKTAAELAQEMPKIANRLRYRAGVRVGDLPRSDADVMKLFGKIPGTSKLGGKEYTIRQFLRDTALASIMRYTRLKYKSF
ncbi:hypothetical protein [Nostoc sp.]|uniref:hypothetical protein n=1 Tax=Nostoc sp. TaxID=1180 RepID=UPI002FF7C98E